MSSRAVSAARLHAVRSLREILERGARATALLAERSKNLSPADGDLLREIVLGVLRTRSALDAELAAACRVPIERLAPNLREILEVALYQIRYLDRVPSYAAVDEAVRHAKKSGGEGAAKLVNAVLRTILREESAPASALPPLPRGGARGVGGAAPRLTSAPAATEGRASRSERPAGRGEGRADAAVLAVRFSHPEFLVARWIKRFGQETTRQILQADNGASPLDLMANPRKTDRDTLSDALRAEGIETETSPFSPLVLTIVSGRPLRSPLFRAGHFSVQDVASQALPLLLPPGETLVDLAAAPGGKSFAALALGRAKRTFAIDRSVSRLRLFAENRKHLAMAEAVPVAGDFVKLPLPLGRFDRVLFDAPCCGTGTLRKNPEIRYRITPAAIDRLSKTQAEGLAAAAKLLAPGGYLLYSTCSLEPEENERVVEHVLARDAGLEPAPIEATETLQAFVTGHRFQILPGPTNDGFTAHLVRRKA